MIENTLQNSLSFWNKLNASEKQFVIDNSQIKHFEAHQTIYNHDTECMGLMLIINGELRTYLLSPNGKEVSLYRLYQDDYCILSASCVLKSINFEVHIDTELATDIILIPSTVLQSLQSKHLDVENFILKGALERFDDVMWSMQQIMFLSFDQRLASFIVDESVKNKSLTINITHEQIAKYLNSAREVVSRMLKYFEKEQLIKLHRGGFEITNISKLKELL